MLKQEIRASVEYGFRDKPVQGSHLEHVRVLEHIRGNKWKVEWIDPNPGLVHYAESGQLVCIWKKRRVFLDEEERRQRLKERNEEQGYSEKSPLTGLTPECTPVIDWTRKPEPTFEMISA